MATPYNNIRLTIGGGSHEAALSMTLGGLPSGLDIDVSEVQKFLDRRKSGKYAFSTPRRERDEIIFESGIENGKISGEIRAKILNENTRPSDYGYSVTPRPSHADFVAVKKYGSAPSGGGAFSGRMTAPLCIGGGIAKQLLSQNGIEVLAYISEIANIECSTYNNGIPNPDLVKRCHDYPFPVTDLEKIAAIEKRLGEIALNKDSAGGVIECIAYNLPIGLGGVFGDGLEGRLAFSLFGIPAVKSVESGLGKDISRLTGKLANDPFEIKDGKVFTSTNNSGGINGGISNGMPLTLRVAFRPTPSIAAEQKTVNLETMENTVLTVRGRHDIAFLPRAVAAVESAVSLVLLDEMIGNRLI